ncbi:50S ribosomal protein L37e [Candidatus Woesearchaeota archaeon]|nr:50S ribosomal protein L37e [Candidatus Woesearchaeota archaeon]HIH38966.1 50S ribosomal protein L37e [Candidatus Woesearchaeota archaeon]HIH48993.1 50S ribosomal protein L37e [Candidatus Woesearchaeota archaeon]HIJ04116.1 50S ribosomal protein L37e [Candidatus Woesearchaeota archaeon]
MTKGTPTQGRRTGKKLHIACRRCGKVSYHMKKKECASCGYGKTAKKKSFGWKKPGK